MAFLEYMLLALLGSAGAATPAGTPARTFTADSVTQPSGGTEGVGQKKPASANKEAGTATKGRSHARRHHRRGHKGGKVYEKATRNASKT